MLFFHDTTLRTRKKNIQGKIVCKKNCSLQNVSFICFSFPFFNLFSAHLFLESIFLLEKVFVKFILVDNYVIVNNLFTDILV